jgi:hypothetical protein
MKDANKLPYKEFNKAFESEWKKLRRIDNLMRFWQQLTFHWTEGIGKDIHKAIIHSAIYKRFLNWQWNRAILKAQKIRQAEADKSNQAMHKLRQAQMNPTAQLIIMNDKLDGLIATLNNNADRIEDLLVKALRK